MSKARVLCLHGYAQNGAFFRQRIGSLRKALKSVVEEVCRRATLRRRALCLHRAHPPLLRGWQFVFVDAPFPATASFLGEMPEERGEALGWWNESYL